MDKPALKRAPDPAIGSVPPYPDYIAPCLATDIGRPPTGNKWAHEIKLDSFRMQLHLRHGVVTIYSREGHDWTERYRSVADQAAQLTAEHLVIDGEMVVLRNDGTSDFWALQKTRPGISDRVTYFAFDLLYQNGEDLRRRPFLERKESCAERSTHHQIEYGTSNMSRWTGRPSGHAHKSTSKESFRR